MDIDLGEGSSSNTTHQIRSEIIKASQLVLIKVPTGDARSVKLDKDA